MMILWLADEFGAPEFVFQPEALNWLFQPLRVITVGFLLWFSVLALLPAGGAVCRRQAAVCALTGYAALSLAAVAVTCAGAFCFIVTSTTEKQVDLIKFRTLSWVLELMVWWSLVLLAHSVGAFRSWRASHGGMAES